MSPSSSPNVSRDSLPDNSILDTSVVSASKYSGTFLEGISLPKQKRTNSQTRLQEGYYEHQEDNQEGCHKFSCGVNDNSDSCVDHEKQAVLGINNALNKVLDTVETIVFFPVSGGVKMCTGINGGSEIVEEKKQGSTATAVEV